MREKVLNILGLLSQSVSQDKDLFYDAEEIWDDLLHRGYSENDIESAIQQMEKMLLEIPGPYWSDQIPVHRCFTKEEATRLSPRVQGYLWQLKTRGIIDHALEDEIVHRVMNLEEHTGLREMKTVVALTIFSHEHKIQLDRGSLSISDSLLN